MIGESRGDTEAHKGGAREHSFDPGSSFAMDCCHAYLFRE
jgi:hypothetical protein